MGPKIVWDVPAVREVRFEVELLHPLKGGIEAGGGTVTVLGTAVRDSSKGCLGIGEQETGGMRRL